MYPILGAYGPFFLYSYTVVMGVGILAGLGLTARQWRNTPDSNWIDGILIGLLLGLPGGRVGFVVANALYFAERPVEIWPVWLGGLSYHGALLTGLLGWWGWCRWRKRPFSHDANRAAPGLALAHTFGWLACWLEGSAYGLPTFLGFWAADLPDTYGVFAVRYQTQLAGMVAGLLILGLAIWIRQKRPFFPIFWLTLGLLNTTHAVISLYRGDSMPKLGDWRVDTLFGLLFALLSAILLYFQAKRIASIKKTPATQLNHRER